MVKKARRVALHMKGNEPTLEGLLVKQYRREFVLLDARVVEDADRTHSLDGRVVVLRENILCFREIG